ncbi:alpha/beta fold hydrolase [Nocardioides marmoriginsengisoli]|uniref:alpha/beta fold hydrolase n=1 Tax=Nocardioides marmoriginsengisoli TaxID=661483 RepID=UPI001C8365AE|nr:alpha/beta fold hydrolase [Nocardioides marmoriginsengisoli]
MSGPFPATGTSTVEVGGVPLRVRVSGPGDGTPILLIHGIARSLEDWNESQDLLAAAGHRVISTDLPGFGYSRKGRERPGLPAFGRAMAGLLDALGVTEPVHVMGNSLGGGVSMTLAVDHPDRVASVTLVNSVGFGSEVNISALPMTYGVLAQLPGLAGTFGPRAREAGANTIRDLFFDRSLATTDQFRHAGKLAKQKDFRATFLGTAATLGAPVVGVKAGWRRELLGRVAASGIPILVIWGDADKILPPHQVDAAKAALPAARFHVFADTGHMPQVERPAEFVAVAGAFVDEVQAARRTARG